MAKAKENTGHLSGNYIIIKLMGGLVSPADATTYYGGLAHGAVLSNLFSTTDGLFACYFPISGRIVKAVLSVSTPGTTSTTEPSTVYLRVNTTDYLISDAVLTDARNTVYTKTLTVKPYIKAGVDFLQIKFVAATWATNPTNVSMLLQLYIQET